MVLVEGPLAEEHDELGPLDGAGPPIDVVVHEPSAGQGEALVEAAQLVPDLAPAEEAAALPHGAEETSPR